MVDLKQQDDAHREEALQGEGCAKLATSWAAKGEVCVGQRYAHRMRLRLVGAAGRACTQRLGLLKTCHSKSSQE